MAPTVEPIRHKCPSCPKSYCGWDKLKQHHVKTHPHDVLPPRPERVSFQWRKKKQCDYCHHLYRRLNQHLITCRAKREEEEVKKNCDVNLQEESFPCTSQQQCVDTACDPMSSDDPVAGPSGKSRATKASETTQRGRTATVGSGKTAMVVFVPRYGSSSSDEETETAQEGYANPTEFKQQAVDQRPFMHQYVDFMSGIYGKLNTEKTQNLYRRYMDKYLEWLESDGTFDRDDLLRFGSKRLVMIPSPADFLERYNGHPHTQLHVVNSFLKLCKFLEARCAAAKSSGQSIEERRHILSDYAQLRAPYKDVLVSLKVLTAAKDEKGKKLMKTAGVTTSHEEVVQLIKRFLVSDYVAEKFRQCSTLFACLQAGEVTCVQVRNFLMLTLLISTCGNRGDAIMNMTLKDWNEADEFEDEGRKVYLVDVGVHKTHRRFSAAQLPILDRNLVDAVNSYILRARPQLFDDGSQSSGFVFPAQGSGKRVNDMGGSLRIFNGVMNVPPRKRLGTMRFRHACAEWAQQCGDEYVMLHMAEALSHTATMHEKRYLAKKGLRKSRIAAKFFEDIADKDAQPLHVDVDDGARQQALSRKAAQVGEAKKELADMKKKEIEERSGSRALKNRLTHAERMTTIEKFGRTPSSAITKQDIQCAVECDTAYASYYRRLDSEITKLGLVTSKILITSYRYELWNYECKRRTDRRYLLFTYCTLHLFW